MRARTSPIHRCRGVAPQGADRLQVGRWRVGLLAWLALTGCRSMPWQGDSVPTSTPLAAATVTDDGRVFASIADGLLHTHATSADLWRREIREQLQYLTGALLGARAVVDLNELVVSVDTAAVTHGVDGVVVVPYTAAFALSAASGPGAPAEIELLLPSGGGVDERRAFFAAYSRACVDAGGDVALPATFWYAYRPAAPACPLRDGPSAATQRVHVRTAPIAPVPEGLAPDYAAMWADKRLVVTALFTGAAGWRAMSEAERQLTKAFGASGTPQGRDPRDRALTYVVAGRGALDMRLLYTEALATGDRACTEAFAARAPLSDALFVVAAEPLGTAERALAATWLPASKEQLRVIGWSAAGPFSYFDGALETALGGGESPDLVAAAATDPSANLMVTVVRALTAGTPTYREIAAQVSASTPLRVQAGARAAAVATAKGTP